MITISGTGTISRDIEVNTSKTGNPYARLSICVKTSKKDSSGKFLFDFMTLFIVRGKHIEYLTKYCQKGNMIEFSGKFEPRKYKNKDEVEISGYSVIVNEISKLTVKENFFEPTVSTVLKEEAKDETPF